MKGGQCDMDKEFFLTGKNKKGNVVNVTAFHVQGLEGLKEFPQLFRLKITGGSIRNFTGLENCPKLEELEIGPMDIDDFSSLGENRSIKELTVAGYYDNVLETVRNLKQLESFSFVYGIADGTEKLKDLKGLKQLYLDKVKNISDLTSILSLKNLTRLKVNMPQGCAQEEIDWFLYSIKNQLPNLSWLELGMKQYEFHPTALKGLQLKHLSVTGKSFVIA